jgi:hypothetical protein
MFGLIKSRSLSKKKCIYKISELLTLSKRQIKMTKAKNKIQKPNQCSKCKGRHLPPTGAKCTRMPESVVDRSFQDSEGGEAAQPKEGNMNSFQFSPGDAGSSHSLVGEVRNMTSIMAQLITRLDSQDARIEAIQKTLGSHHGQASLLISSSQDASPPVISSTCSAPSLMPTLQQFRQDPTLVQQANRQIDRLDDDTMGMSSKGNSVNTRAVKRGLARIGGDNAPIMNIPWPHDFVLGSGEKRRLHYGDLTWSQFIQGFATIMEREPQEAVVRAMISHLKFWAMEAGCLGYEHAKFSHANILTDMEDGLYGWLNREAITEARKNIITAPPSAQEVRSSSNYNFSRNNFNSGKKAEFRKAGHGEKTALPCYNFNEGKCKQSGDHESGNLLWRHTCFKCLQDGHVSKDCPRRQGVN